MITCYFEKTKKPTYLRHVVVDMLVINGNKILLVKRGGPKWYLETGKWAMPGGYLEMGETCEETGYEAKVIKFLGINDNPRRPHELNRQNVSLVYLLKPIRKVNGHDDEISQVKWFALDKAEF